MISVEEWLKTIILSLKTFNYTVTDNTDAQNKLDELEKILKQLEEKENTVKDICKDCREYGSQYGDVQKLIRELQLGLNANINVIRENQNIIKSHLTTLKEQADQPVIEIQEKEEVMIPEIQKPDEVSVIKSDEPQTETRIERVEEQIITEVKAEEEKVPEIVEQVKPETQAIATQTTPDKPSTDNFMIIQSVGSEGETIHIYNMPHEEEDDKNVTVEAKYVRGRGGEPMRTSELVLKNVPKHFETTFVEPDETTTEIIVDPDGTKRIIVRKLTKTTHQIVNQKIFEGEEIPEHLKPQLDSRTATHDIIVSSGDPSALEQHPEITESSLSAVIEHITHRVIKKTRRIVKKITIIDGKEHITEEVVEEPDEIQEFEEDRPAIEYELSQTVVEEPIIEKITVQEMPEKEEITTAVETRVIEEVKTSEILEVVEQPSKADEPEKIEDAVQQIEEPEIIPKTDDSPKEVEEEKPIKPAEEPLGEQVFEIVTEAPVDLIASNVDNLAPIENVEDIWPYSTPHITPQSDLPVDLPAETEKYKDSESIWPQNLTIGSNIDFNEYSFERTLEKSSDYLDNSSFTVVDAGLSEISEQPKDVTDEVTQPKEDEYVKVEEETPKEEIVQPKLDEIEIKDESNKDESEIPKEQVIEEIFKDIEKKDDKPKADKLAMTLEFIEHEKYVQEPSSVKEQDVKLPEEISEISETIVENKEEALPETTVSVEEIIVPEKISEEGNKPGDDTASVEEKPLPEVTPEIPETHEIVQEKDDFKPEEIIPKEEKTPLSEDVISKPDIVRDIEPISTDDEKVNPEEVKEDEKSITEEVKEEEKPTIKETITIKEQVDIVTEEFATEPVKEEIHLDEALPKEIDMPLTQEPSPVQEQVDINVIQEVIITEKEDSEQKDVILKEIIDQESAKEEIPKAPEQIEVEDEEKTTKEQEKPEEIIPKEEEKPEEIVPKEEENPEEIVPKDEEKVTIHETLITQEQIETVTEEKHIIDTTEQEKLEEVVPKEEEKPQKEDVVELKEQIEIIKEKDIIPEESKSDESAPKEDEKLPLTEIIEIQERTDFVTEEEIIPEIEKETFIEPENKTVEEKPLQSEVSPPSSPPAPQLATITIVKTLTFLEKEKETANELIPESIETRMIVRTPEPVMEELEKSEVEEVQLIEKPDVVEEFVTETTTTSVTEQIKEDEPKVEPEIDISEYEVIDKDQVDEIPKDIQEGDKVTLPNEPEQKEMPAEEKLTPEEELKNIPQQEIPTQEVTKAPEEPENQTLQEKPKEQDFETFQVLLKVDPSEVTKVNVNLTEESPLSSTPIEQLESPPESIEQKSLADEPTAVEIVDVKEPEKVITDISTVRTTGYEGEDKDDSTDSKGKKKKKRDKKKKQAVKPEDVPSAIPKSTEASHAPDATSIMSSDNENVMPEEEVLPEGREELLSPDESYRSISETDPNQIVKILEESVIQSPDESIKSQPDTGIVYPGEVMEVTYVEDTEQQTEPVSLPEEQQISEPVEKDTKEIQTIELQTTEIETQMSPVIEKEFEFVAPIPTKETSDTSMQTIIMQFIESESQTTGEPFEEKKPQQEQEIQTEQFVSPDEKPTDKQESSVQTIIIETTEKVAQTEVPKEDEIKVCQEIIEEITTRALEEAEKQKEAEPIVESIPEQPKEQIPTANVETQTKKSKKSKKQKSKDDQKTELEIETIVTQPSKPDEKSLVSMTLAPETNLENIDVQIKLNIAPQNEADTVLRRLNDIMNIETNEVPKESFTLSQNLNNLINNTDQKGFEVVPWSDVQYMIDTNIDNRRINNTNEFMTNNLVDEPVDDKINESLQKIEQYIDILPEVVNSKEEKLTQKTIIVITKVIVTCLEQIEYKIYRMKQNKTPTPEDTNELKRLEDLLAKLKENVAPIENPDIARCIDTLQQHIDLDKEVQEDVCKDIKNFYTEVNSADDTIKRLQQETIILEDRYQYILQTEFPNDDKMKHLESLELACKDNKKSALRAIKMKNLNDDQINIVKSCYDRTKDMEHVARIERRKLIQLINLTEEYVQTLNEFSQITLIANSLVDKTIVTNSLEHLHNEIQRHRKFFINLNHCRNILESLERNLDPETREKHSELHNALYQKATNILEKAGERSQKLALAASKWTVLEKRMKNEEQWLQVLEQRVPDLSSVTSADYEQYITLYQSLNSDLTMHQAKMCQNYETSIKLQDLICAPNLETKCNDSLTKLLKIKEDVNTYLKRLLHFKQMWYEYNLNADKLEHWMNQVEDELNKIDIPENFMTYPVENMRNFWEIKAQYEFNHQIHKNVCENFDKSLKVISIADDKLQLQFYAQLDDRWQTITNRIDAIKSQITENISSTIPSYNDKLLFLENELDELMFIINNTKGIIRNPEELNLYIERLIVLKSRIVVVENELVTIGFISTSDTEKVGELCEKSHKISLCITEEMELADLCKGRINTLRQEIGVIRENQVDFYDRLTDFEGAAKLESAAIESALEGCQICRENLVTHWKDIMRVRHLLHTLPTGLRMSVSPVDIEKEISQLEDDYVDIEKRLCEIENLLKNRFALWKRFEKQLEIIQQSIQETDFMVELLTVHGNIDYERLLKATERLEVNNKLSNLLKCH